jgi:hypothetical protein
MGGEVGGYMTSVGDGKGIKHFSWETWKEETA